MSEYSPMKHKNSNNKNTEMFMKCFVFNLKHKRNLKDGFEKYLFHKK